MLPVVPAAGLPTGSKIVNLPVNLHYCKCRQIPEITVPSFQTSGLDEQINAKADELTLEHLESLLVPKLLTQHVELLKSSIVFSKQFLG